MSTQPKSIKQISADILAGLSSSFGSPNPIFPWAFQNVLSKIFGGVYVILYKYIGFMGLQQFVSFASGKETVINGKTLIPLVEWGRLLGVGDPNPATRAEHTVQGVSTVSGQTIPGGTPLVSSRTGVTFITKAAVVTGAPQTVVNLDVKAASDQDGNGGRGSIGNLEIGEIISFVNSQSVITTDVEVTVNLVTGVDAETTEEYRLRVVDRFRNQPQGGAYYDYKLWALEVEGIVNVYVYRSGLADGAVDLYCEATPASSGDPDGIPSAAQLTAVEDAVLYGPDGLQTRAPVNANPDANAIFRTIFDVEITGLVVDDETAVKAEISEALTRYFLATEPWIVGMGVGKRRDRITQSAVGGAVQDVVSARSGVFTSLTVEVQGGSPFTTYTLETAGAGEKAKLGVVTYV